MRDSSYWELQNGQERLTATKLKSLTNFYRRLQKKKNRDIDSEIREHRCFYFIFTIGSVLFQIYCVSISPPLPFRNNLYDFYNQIKSITAQKYI